MVDEVWMRRVGSVCVWLFGWGLACGSAVADEVLKVGAVTRVPAPSPGWDAAVQGTHGLVTLVLFTLLLLARRRLRAAERREAAAREALADAPDPSNVTERSGALDPLTGLTGRLAWIAQAEGRVAAARSTGQPQALLLIDLDRLSCVNHTYGQRAGDRALQGVAHLLRAALGADDLAGRHGGEQFVALLAGRDDTAVQALAQGLGSAVAHAPVALDDGRHVSVTVSIGVARPQLPAVGMDGPAGLELLLRQADTALQVAKAEGRDAVRTHDATLVDPQVWRLQTARELGHALAADQLRLDYQAVYDAGGHTPVAAEALLRWHHPTRGIVPPAQFIEIAEASGLIVPIGAWVLRRACADAMRWPRPLPVAVNLSVRQLHGRDLIDQVRAALAESGLPAERLELELTESALANTPQVAHTLAELRALGVTLSLDDFGTGFSSLAYLQRYRFDRLKIDRAFVQPLQNADGAPLALVRALVDLARALGMRCTAEGIEHAHQLKLLGALGCDAMQGFHLARPCGAAELLGRLALPPDGAGLAPAG